MTDRSTANGFRRVEMSAILSVLKPLDASSRTTTDRKRRLIASVCRLIGDELNLNVRRDPGCVSIPDAPHRRSNGRAPAPPANQGRTPDSSRDGDGDGDAARDGDAAPPHLLLQLEKANDGALSPRLEQTLQSLLSGDSEKQVAHKLGLSRHTVHVYVKKLYRRYGVSSRGELLAKWVAR